MPKAFSTWLDAFKIVGAHDFTSFLRDKQQTPNVLSMYACVWRVFIPIRFLVMWKWSWTLRMVDWMNGHKTNVKADWRSTKRVWRENDGKRWLRFFFFFFGELKTSFVRSCWYKHTQMHSMQNTFRAIFFSIIAFFPYSRTFQFVRSLRHGGNLPVNGCRMNSVTVNMTLVTCNTLIPEMMLRW